MKTSHVVVVLTCLAIAATSGRAARAQQAQPQAFTFQGGVALWTIAINADKTADFEKVMAKLREGLGKSQNPERKQQLVGWKVVKVQTPLADGTTAYVHIINPVVPGADYSIMHILYDEFPDERQALYELYRGAFAKNLSLATGTLTVDMSKAPQSAAAPAAP